MDNLIKIAPLLFVSTLFSLNSYAEEIVGELTYVEHRNTHVRFNVQTKRDGSRSFIISSPRDTAKLNRGANMDLNDALLILNEHNSNKDNTSIVVYTDESRFDVNQGSNYITGLGYKKK
ncbi:hypothetical protein [Vibrio lentus]|uniref:hypothetical protein n=1 Tax=Vibrio lentus TaxID=136468 RepID=UPI000C836187|nr:hypothetical protein [Vibrio lentus]PMM40590.1 hypothetical protein BCT58_00020 [Vibrio lentus]